jgi:hypothetical protein
LTAAGYVQAAEPRAGVDTSGWTEFTLPASGPVRGGAADLSGLLDPPAGKHGFLAARNGHFFFPNGQRQKFWGMNVGWDALPKKEEAPIIARRLAAFGINLVRFARQAEEQRSRGAEEKDRFDFFVAELKKNGVYIHIVLDFEEVRGPEVYSDDRLGDAHRKLADELLLRKNPYTGLRYVDEPAVAIVQIVNEESVFNYPAKTAQAVPPALAARWNRWLLERYKDRAGLAQAWTADNSEAGKAVSALLPGEDPEKGNVDLAGCMPHPEAESDAPKDGLRSPLRVSDAARFLAETERAYYEKFYKHLREIGVKCPIICASAGAGTAGNLAHTWAACVGDAVAVNGYWDCANAGEKGSPAPMVKVCGGVLSQIAAASVAGKPLMVTEAGFCGTSPYPCEGPLLAAAYGALEDWDGLAWGGGGGTAPWREARHERWDPVQVAQFPVAARVFLQNAVSPARISTEVVFTEPDLFDAQRWPWSATGGLAEHSPPTWLPFLSRMRSRLPGSGADEAKGSDPRESRVQLYWGSSVKQVTTSWGGKTLSLAERGPQAGVAGKQKTDAVWMYKQYLKFTREQSAPRWGRKMAQAPFFTSDTGQLRWNYGAGRFEIEAPGCQGVVGEWGGASRDLSALSVKPSTPFCAISGISLDDKPLKDSKHILICAAGKATPSSQGGSGVLLEPVKAEIGLKHNFFSSLLGVRWRVWALDPAGQRVKEVPTWGLMNFTGFKIGETATSLWYEVEVTENALVPFAK